METMTVKRKKEQSQFAEKKKWKKIMQTMYPTIPERSINLADLEIEKACVTRQVLEKKLKTTCLTWMGGERWEYCPEEDNPSFEWKTIVYSPTNKEINEVYGKQLLKA